MNSYKLSEGTACILVKYSDDKDEKTLLNYLKKNNFINELRGPLGMNQYKYNWYWININSKVYCIGKPGVKYTNHLCNHAIIPIEFKTIYNIFIKYKDKQPLEM